MQLFLPSGLKRPNPAFTGRWLPFKFIQTTLVFDENVAEFTEKTNRTTTTCRKLRDGFQEPNTEVSKQEEARKRTMK